MPGIDFQVRKTALADTRCLPLPEAALAQQQVRVRIDSFALTANNITYAAFGDAMNYWGFYPAADGWGHIPVWGFGTVSQSSHPGVAVGERLYGYYPMASSVLLSPTRLSPAGFSDGAPHRANLHAIYNQYLRCASDPLYRADTEDLQALLRPLYMTSWLIDDFLADQQFFGARALMLSSASSKTAYGTAHALSQRGGIELIGLTSEANRGFCESLGCYSRVLSYEQLDQIAADTPCVYVDFAGSAALRSAIHSRFGNLAYSCAIGGTHVHDLGGSKALPGPKPTLFFAPAQAQKRRTDWGGEGLQQRLLGAWQGFIATVAGSTPPWLQVEHHRGAEAVSAAYQAMLAGRIDPRRGLILSLAT